MAGACHEYVMCHNFKRPDSWCSWPGYTHGAVPSHLQSCKVSPRAVLFLLNALVDTYGLLHFYPLLMRIQREIRNLLSWRPCTLSLTNFFCPDTVCAARPTNTMPRTAIVLWFFVFFLSSGRCLAAECLERLALVHVQFTAIA